MSLEKQEINHLNDAVRHVKNSYKSYGITSNICSEAIKHIKERVNHNFADHISNLEINSIALREFQIYEDTCKKEHVDIHLIDKKAQYVQLKATGSLHVPNYAPFFNNTTECSTLSFKANARIDFKGEYTLAIVKPDAYNNAEGIINMIKQSGLKIAKYKGKELKISKQLNMFEVSKFYAVHATKPFFESNCSFMSSGASMIIVLCGEDSVKRYRALMGATNPNDAIENTIRKKYGSNIEHNAVHGSDSLANAQIEIKQFFPELLEDISI